MSDKNRRWRLFADFKIQGICCLRIIVYWFVCQFAMCATIAGIASLEGPVPDAGGSVFRFIIPAFFISLFILPIALLDALIFTNRIMGPLFHFRRQFSRLAAAQSVAPIKFRKQDYFCDLEQELQSPS